MARQCDFCHKGLGFFNKKYTCTGCGRIVCSDCVRFLDLSKDVKTYEDIDRYDGNHFFEETFLVVSRVIPKHTFFTRLYYLCPNCVGSANKTISKLKSVFSSRPNVEFVSKNYKGLKKYVGSPIPIETDWYRDFKNAQLQLSIIAAFYDCDMVINVEREQETRSEQSDKAHSKGTHYYSVWRYVGKAVKKG